MKHPKFEDEEVLDERERGKRAGEKAPPTPAHRRDDVVEDTEDAWKRRLKQLGLLKDD